MNPITIRNLGPEEAHVLDRVREGTFDHPIDPSWAYGFLATRVNEIVVALELGEVVGFASGTIPKVALNLALLKRCSIVGVDWGGEMRANPAINADLGNTLTAWIEDGSLTPSRVCERPASGFVTAFEDQLAGRITGKLVLTR